MNVTVLGTGYVGLVSGAGLAAKGHNVTCLDLRPEIVERLNRGEATIHEAGLPELLAQIRKAGTFRAALVSAKALEGSDVILLAVGTPSVDGRIDLAAIEAASATIGDYLRIAKKFTTVIVKSTVIPGTTDTLLRRILEQRSGKRVGEFGLAMNPEFLREGEAVDDFMHPDRIVLGHEDPGALAALGQLYAPWTCEKIAVSTRTAEMIKYANNCLLATQISAVNEIANIAAAVGGIDVMEVMRGVHLDKRWNPIAGNGDRVNPPILSYLIPGCGFGGSCFPKDVQAMRTQGQTVSVPTRLLQAVLDINEDQPGEMVRILENAVGSLSGRRVLVLGIAFKPGTDDVRESPALRMISMLRERGAQVEAHDPVAMDQAKGSLPAGVTLVDDWTKALSRADAVLIATKWQDYRELAVPANVAQLAGKIVADPRRLFRGTEFPSSCYLAIGFTPRTDASERLEKSSYRRTAAAGAL